MLVFRITTKRWAGVLTASGYPARWNSKGTRIIYTASTRALACLENLVHRSGEGLNQQFRITEIYIPDHLSKEKVNHKDLPVGWHQMESYHHCQNIGDGWVDNAESLLLEVPSSIIRDESNILINPYHPEFSTIEVQNITSFSFDERL
ncbi:MAG: RES family NAD+ phosphorylase [Balneolaceae bacterium]|nr:RES family NAD+ phosphorylase [Balneolaceae bacterium]MDR9407432.1 RES family NAD+ phosphorylase [Balneolaceae bacterium]